MIFLKIFSIIYIENERKDKISFYRQKGKMNMKYQFDVYDNDNKIIWTETVASEGFMSVFGTSEPSKEDLDEAGFQLVRYFKAGRFEVKEVI